MIIMQCSKCGRMIHKASQCCYCGVGMSNSAELQENIHKNAECDYQKALNALYREQFDAVLELSETLIQWMPQNSEVYWLRFLAKNKATDDEGLILLGAVCDDMDYLNAERFATDERRSVYTNVKAGILRLGSLVQAESRKYVQQRGFVLLDGIDITRDKCWELCRQLNEIESAAICFMHI